MPAQRPRISRIYFFLTILAGVFLFCTGWAWGRQDQSSRQNAPVTQPALQVPNQQDSWTRFQHPELPFTFSYPAEVFDVIVERSTANTTAAIAYLVEKGATHSNNWNGTCGAYVTIWQERPHSGFPVKAQLHATDTATPVTINGYEGYVTEGTINLGWLNKGTPHCVAGSRWYLLSNDYGRSMYGLALTMLDSPDYRAVFEEIVDSFETTIDTAGSE